MPRRAVVTGASGFVGTRMVACLVERGEHPITIPATVDITDREAIGAAITEAHPDVIFHLAGQANVGSSWKDASVTYSVNFDGTRNVLDAARLLVPMPRVIVVSSADVYGPLAFNGSDRPVDETTPARPVSPYGASKLAAEVVARQAFDGYGLPVIITRAFSHIGPGQSDGFVVSSIARQIAEAERDGGEQIELGNLEPERDFLDVDDVVRAYDLASRHGLPGVTYNVASGVAVPIRDVLEHLLTQASRPLRVFLDPERLRPVDVPRMVGDASRLRADTGWVPTSCWQDAATAALTDWRCAVG